MYDMRKDDVDKPKANLPRLTAADILRTDVVLVEATCRRFTRSTGAQAGSSSSKSTTSAKKKVWETWRVELRLEHLSLLSRNGDD